MILLGAMVLRLNTVSKQLTIFNPNVEMKDKEYQNVLENPDLEKQEVEFGLKVAKQSNQNHVPKDKKMYQCKKCDISFVLKTSLKRHENIHKEGNNPYACNTFQRIH